MTDIKNRTWEEVLSQLWKVKEDIDKEKDRDKLRELNKTLKQKYREFMKKITEWLNSEYQNGLASLDVEEFVKPKGICEGIAVGITFKRTQLRKFFAEVKNIERTKDENLDTVKVSMLVPKLAYSKARGLIDEDFFQFMKIFLEIIRKSKKKEDYDKFVNIFEAIVAFHYYYNPKED